MATKRYRIARTWLQGYDFIDQQTKRAMKGVTPKALVLECDPSGAVHHSSIEKMSKDAMDRVPSSGANTDCLYYDKFGRIVGWQD